MESFLSRVLAKFIWGERVVDVGDEEGTTTAAAACASSFGNDLTGVGLGWIYDMKECQKDYMT